MYAITRLKAARNAWYWAVHFWRRGKLYFKRFYDLKSGGSMQARAAAIAWRDEQIAQAEVLTLRDFHAQRRSNNTSGVPGVHLVKSASQPDGAWQAKITLPDGHKVHKSFSIRKFGHAEAFDLAVKARTELLELVDNRAYLKHPVAKRMAAKSGKK